MLRLLVLHSSPPEVHELESGEFSMFRFFVDGLDPSMNDGQILAAIKPLVMNEYEFPEDAGDEERDEFWDNLVVDFQWEDTIGVHTLTVTTVLFGEPLTIRNEVEEHKFATATLSPTPEE